MNNRGTLEPNINRNLIDRLKDIDLEMEICERDWKKEKLQYKLQIKKLKDQINLCEGGQNSKNLIFNKRDTLKNQKIQSGHNRIKSDLPTLN